MDCVGKIFVVPVLRDFGLKLLRSQVLEGGDVVLDSHSKDFGVPDEMNLWAGRRHGLYRRGRARSGPLGRGSLSRFLLWRRRRAVWDFDDSRSCSRVVLVEVVQVIEVSDHQLHDLRVVAGVFRLIRVRVYGLELDGAGLSLLSYVSKGSKLIPGNAAETYLERVCLHGCPEVLGVYADCQLVNLEVVWAADDSTIGVFFAFEVAWMEISICISSKERRQAYFSRPAFQASIGVAMFEGWALPVGGCLLGIGL